MGFLSKILGSGDVIEKGFDLIDKMHTSDAEEIAADTDSKVRLIEAKTKAKSDLMKAYAPFKIAQRYLALIFAFNFFIGFWVSVYLWAVGKDLAGFIELMSTFQIGWAMTTIVIFYFGGGFVEGAIGASKQRNKD